MMTNFFTLNVKDTELIRIDDLCTGLAQMSI